MRATKRRVPSIPLEANASASVDEIERLIRGLDVEGEREPRRVVERLVALGSAVVPRLIARLEQVTKPRWRRWIAHALGTLGDPRAIGALKAVLTDPHMTVRLHAMEALSCFPARRVERSLILLLRDPSGGVRVRAIGALIRVGTRRADRELLAATRDEKWYVRQEAARALGDLGTKQAGPRLKELLGDPRKAVRAAAKTALAKLSARADTTPP
jgi:HEAT repeat protein